MLQNNSLASKLQRLTPWYYGWNILGVAFAFQAITFGLTFYCFTFWVAPWMAEFSVSRSTILAIIILVQVGMGACAPFIGKAFDRFSPRLLIIGGILCYALALALSSVAPSMWMVILCYGTLIVMGNLLAGSLAAQILVIRWFSAKRGTAIGLVAVGTSFGGLVLPPVVTWLLTEYGWRTTSLTLAVVMASVLIPLVWFFIRNNPRELGLSVEVVTEEAADQNADSLPKWTTKGILKERVFWVLSCVLMPIITAFGAFGQNLGPFAKDLGIESQQSAFLVSTMASAMIIGKVFFGAMTDRCDHRYLFVVANISSFIAFTILSINNAPSYPLMFIISFFVGLASGSILPLMAAVISQRFGVASFGHATGLFSLPLIITALGPWAAGYMRDIQGNYNNAWAMLLILLVPSLFAIAFLPQPQISKQDKSKVNPLDAGSSVRRVSS